jgi:peptide/nickel transport system permease protein
MFGYIVRRLVAAFLVIVVTSVMVFALFVFGPANPAATLCNNNGRCTSQRMALYTHSLGLDQSFAQQYGTFVKGLVSDRVVHQGAAAYTCSAPCLGISYLDTTQIRNQLTSRFPATLSIAIGGAIIELLVGLTMGSIAARLRGSFTDRSLVTSSLFVSSFPPFVIFLLAWIYLFSIWHIFPTPGYNPFLHNPAAWAAGLLLPWLCLGITGSTNYARYGRTQMVESLGEDYVRSATAKGVSTNKTVFKHALRAAIVPIVTIFGIDFAYLLSGTIVLEKIFGIQGIGLYSLTAVFHLDYPAVNGTVLFAAVIIVLANIIVDVLYSVLDPRVRLT